MRTLLFLSCLICLLCYRGITNPTASSDEDTCDYVRVVRVIMEERKLGFSSGISEKLNARLGDNVSVALLKMYDEHELTNPQNIRLFLPIIRASFPTQVEFESCRRDPKVTVFFLRWLQGDVRDTRSKHEIAQTLAAVMKASSTVKGKP